MSYQVLLKAYRYPFYKPLKTFHGLWSEREGLLVGLQSDDGQIGWGEVAPIPWFGTETLAEAIAFCQTLPSFVSKSDLLSIPDQLPACQFGVGSALESLQGSMTALNFADLTFCGLLPAGEAAFTTWPKLWQNGYRTFKWKIGVFPIEVELQIFKSLTASLPEGAKIRLDANGGLSVETTKQWIEVCDSLDVEYLEQPLPPVQYEDMVQLTQMHRTPIALDESVTTLKQLIQCYELDWPGVMVIKPAIAGYPQALRSFLQNCGVDVVFSSVFETEVGRNAALAIAQEFNNKNRAVGFGERVFLS